MSVAQLHHARVGVTTKTLSNHKSNVRAALRWFGKEHDVPRRGMPLLASWATLRDRLDKRLRQRLYSFMRYCSARRIEPESVDDGVLDAYWRYRTDTTALASNNARRRFLARTWNACASEINGWPLQRLTEPPIKIPGNPAWEHFPEGLRADLENYWDRLTKPRRGLRDQRIRPCRPATIRASRAALLAMARMAVRQGVPIEKLTSLAALLQPDVVERVIEAYWQKNGDEPKVWTIDLSWKLLRIARETGCLDQAELNRLDEIRASLEDYRRSGLTSKNLRLIRQVLTEGVWSEVVSLPSVLMQKRVWRKTMRRSRPLSRHSLPWQSRF